MRGPALKSKAGERNPQVGVCLKFTGVQRRNDMNDSTKDQAEGKFHEVKGKVKEKVGKAIGNPKLEDEGLDEKVGGKIQKKVGEVEKVFEK